MDFKIIWSPEAILDLESLTNYLKVNWDANVLNSFSDELQGTLETLSKFPFSGIQIKSKLLRKILITKHSYLVYKIKKDKIELLSIIDTRQEPK